jgi:DNA repair protein RecO (recombination protein O)
MASLYQTTGIVLSRRDHREADRWYSVYTHDRGKIEVLARGGHKPLAKLTPHLEMAAEVQLLVVNGKQFYTLAGVERVRAFPNAYADLSRLVLVQNALALVDMGTRTEEADQILYGELVAWLSCIDEMPSPTPERAGYLLGSFALKLLSLLGYRPELQRCLACKIGVASGAYRWHAPKGGVVCMPCVGRDQEQWFAARDIDDAALKLMRYALSESFPDQHRPHLPGVALSQFHEAVESLLISHFLAIPAASLRAACAV